MEMPRLNYSKWDHLADSDEEKKSRHGRYVPTPATTRTTAPGAKPALFGQAMGAEPARQAHKMMLLIAYAWPLPLFDFKTLRS